MDLSISREESQALYLVKDKSKPIDGWVFLLNIDICSGYLNVHEEIFEKYGEKKGEFYLNKLLFEDIDGKQYLIGYDWIYQDENNRIVLEYYFETKSWKIISIQTLISIDPKCFSDLIENLNEKKDSFTFEEQIEYIQKEFHSIFSTLDSQSDDFLSHIVHSNEIQPSSQFQIDTPVLLTDDQFQIDTPVLLTDDQFQIFDKQLETPILIPNDQEKDKSLLRAFGIKHRTRHESSCSSTNSIKYTE